MKISITKKPSVYIGHALLHPSKYGEPLNIRRYSFFFTECKDNDIPTMEQSPMYGRKER